MTSDNWHFFLKHFDMLTRPVKLTVKNIAQSDGTLTHISFWMMREVAAHLDVQSHPRLLLATLREPRIETSSLIEFLESDLPMKEASDETRTAISAPGPVRRHCPGNSATVVHWKTLTELVRESF